VFASLAAASLAATPLPVDYTLPEPVQTVEEPAPAIEDPTDKMYRIGPTKWTDSKRHYDAVQQAKLRRVLFHSLNAADLATTIICLEARDDCRETNPIYGQSTERVIVGKVLTAALFELVHDKDGGEAIGEWLGIGILGLVVGNNLTVVF
jgi:hypothetical protein